MYQGQPVNITVSRNEVSPIEFGNNNLNTSFNGDVAAQLKDAIKNKVLNDLEGGFKEIVTKIYINMEDVMKKSRDNVDNKINDLESKCKNFFDQFLELNDFANSLSKSVDLISKKVNDISASLQNNCNAINNINNSRKEEANIFNKKVLEICNQNMITYQKENKEYSKRITEVEDKVKVLEKIKNNEEIIKKSITDINSLNSKVEETLKLANYIMSKADNKDIKEGLDKDKLESVADFPIDDTQVVKNSITNLNEIFILEVAKNWFQLVPVCTANTHLLGLNSEGVAIIQGLKFKKATIGENIIYEIIENPDLSLEEIMKEVYKSINKQASYNPKNKNKKLRIQWNNRQIQITPMNEDNDMKKTKNYFISNGFRYILLTNSKPNKNNIIVKRSKNLTKNINNINTKPQKRPNNFQKNNKSMKNKKRIKNLEHNVKIIYVSMRNNNRYPGEEAIAQNRINYGNRICQSAI